jgi:SNF2 family DNA or RNA helicase
VTQLAGFDIVVTTYETLSSDFQGRSRKVKGDSNPVAKVKWWRVVLDESHAVKDSATKAFKAIDIIQVRTVPFATGCLCC